MSRAHKCEEYLVYCEKDRYKIRAAYPERAVEILSKHLNREILAVVDGVEYATDRVAQGKYNAYEIFDHNTVVKKLTYVHS